MTEHIRDYYDKSLLRDRAVRQGSPVFDTARHIAARAESARRILDVGIGGGEIIGLIRNRASKVIKGIDIAPAAVEQNRNLDIEVRLCNLDRESIPFGAGEFDTCICSEVLEHLIDPLRVLAEINRILSPGGTLLLSTPNITFLPCRIFLLLGHFTDLTDNNFPPMHIRYCTYNILAKLLATTGFAVKERIPTLRAMEYRFPHAKGLLKLLASAWPNLFSCGHLLVCGKTGSPRETKSMFDTWKDIGTSRGLRFIWEQT